MTPPRIVSALRAAAHALLADVPAPIDFGDAPAPSQVLRPGDKLVIWIKRGDWWSEIKRGVRLQVKAVDGEKVQVHFIGWADGPGWWMKLAPKADLSGKFKLIGDAFRRELVVMRA